MKTRSWICILLAVVLCAAVAVPSAEAACAPGEHDYEVVEIIRQPTCSRQGIANVECKICHYKINTYIDADPSLHVVGSYEIVTPATCTTAGVMNAVCTKCNSTFTKSIPALGHDWNTEYTIDTPATCTENGSKSLHCTRCSTHKEDIVIEAAGHTVVEDPAVPAGCTTPGKTAGSHCSVCDTVITAQTEIPAPGHDYVVETKEPTCTEAGYKESVCSRCNDTITEDLAALGHDMEYVPAKAASYTEEGCKAYYQCKRCSLKFWDEAGEKEAKDEELIIPKLQKSPVSYAPAAAAPSAASYVEIRTDKKTLTPAVSIVKGEAEITVRGGNAETRPDYVEIKSVRALTGMGAKSFCVELNDKLHVKLSFDALKELLKLHGLTDAQIAAAKTVTVAFDEDEENILSVFCGDTELLRIDTESLLRDTNDVKEVLLTLDKDGLAVSHDGKEIAREEITAKGTLAAALSDGKIVLETVEPKA